VAYQVDQGRFFALVVTRSAARLVELTGPERLSSLTGFARAARMIGSDPSDSAAAAYDLLLRPLEDALAGQTRLLISPDRFLSFIPFEALLRREGDRSAWALERWEIAYVPSATVYAALREDARDRPAGSGLVALGDPAYGEVPAEGVVARRIDGIERLEQSGAEVREIGRLFPEPERTLLLGRDATLTGLRAALEGRARPLAALHLACHGEIDEGRPLRSALLLAGGERLGLDEVYALRAPSDLAVLSACDSGRGPLRDGEGVIGLVRGFFFAGCPRVVVANWPVQDESTRRLMTAFYARWRGDRLAPAAALRAAKRDLLAASRETAHPYHWAGFVLWGLPE
jgi:CHAT domain-containing protein